jgi:hypothetical protein
VQLKEFALINPKLKAKGVFQAIQTAIAPEAINQALQYFSDKHLHDGRYRGDWVTG